MKKIMTLVVALVAIVTTINGQNIFSGRSDKGFSYTCIDATAMEYSIRINGGRETIYMDRIPASIVYKSASITIDAGNNYCWKLKVVSGKYNGVVLRPGVYLYHEGSLRRLNNKEAGGALRSNYDLFESSDLLSGVINLVGGAVAQNNANRQVETDEVYTSSKSSKSSSKKSVSLAELKKKQNQNSGSVSTVKVNKTLTFNGNTGEFEF